MDFQTPLKSQYLLDPQFIFLNDGAFGSCPRPVFEAYQAWQKRIEGRPEEYLWRNREQYLAPVRQALARYLGADPANLAFVPNATTGINIVARSLKLQAGDEILASNHEYGAIDRTWAFIAAKTGARYINRVLPPPLTTHDDFIEVFWGAVTDQTRIICLSHITSPTALIFPIAEICARARQAGITTIIDGAHAPGQLDLDLETLGADYYTGNGHKWLGAPRGSAFLYARPEVQSLVEPLIVSWGYQSDHPSGSTFQDYLGWTGTRDLSPYLATAAALDFIADNDWAQVRRRCHRMALDGLARLQSLTGEPPMCENPEQWIAQMFAVLLPERVEPEKLEAELLARYRIEVPIKSWQDKKLVRVSIPAYTSEQDLEQLETALQELL
ncbi:MAG: aminotransferase class V-fold PLP-dependent enzyme [Candidatus Neomarinimicrobiota bacterium]